MENFIFCGVNKMDTSQATPDFEELGSFFKDQLVQFVSASNNKLRKIRAPVKYLL